eukprot:CAMPEP_0118954976 /NCGR_PEP_ID=MMETSP1169-20130426/59260_1 /TAXON_ID=36882 /ORGANISM="Pyramimonas obovata, Strain CCMP722" /LENGTH=208 /DNA_ID=CAMNT_0006902729 /DNA_START=12 /DNA_END=635 /DNA_ORIENTATION=-
MSGSAPKVIRSTGFAASAKPKQVRRDVPRVSEEQDVEEEEEDDEEQPAAAPVDEIPEDMKAFFPMSFGKVPKQAVAKPQQDTTFHEQTKRQEQAKPKKKGKMMMSIGPIKSLATNPPPTDATDGVPQGEPEDSIGSIARRKTPPRDAGPGEAPASAGAGAGPSGAGTSAAGPSGVKSALGAKKAKDYSAEVAGPVQVPTFESSRSADD